MDAIGSTRLLVCGLPVLAAGMLVAPTATEPGTPEQMGACMKENVPRWAEVVRDAGVKPD